MNEIDSLVEEEMSRNSNDASDRLSNTTTPPIVASYYSSSPGTPSNRDHSSRSQALETKVDETGHRRTSQGSV